MIKQINQFECTVCGASINANDSRGNHIAFALLHEKCTQTSSTTAAVKPTPKGTMTLTLRNMGDNRASMSFPIRYFEPFICASPDDSYIQFVRLEGTEVETIGVTKKTDWYFDARPWDICEVHYV